MNRIMVLLCDELGHATVVTEMRGVGFIARCMCGWEDRSSGYDMDAAIRAERRHLEASPRHIGRHLDGES